MNSLLLLTVIIWEGLCNALQMHMTNVKIHALGLQQIARVCKALTGAMACFWVLLFATLCAVLVAPPSSFTIRADYASQAALMLAAASSMLVIVGQLLGLCFAAGRALHAGWQDADIRHTACLLYVNSMLQLLGPMMSVRGVHGFTCFYSAESCDDLTLLTLDISFQVLNVLLLSGLVGPQRWQDPMAAFQKLANLQGFGLASKRIAFSGHVNDNASDCIVSFPGKYSVQWDQAVSVARTRKPFHLLACSSQTGLPDWGSTATTPTTRESAGAVPSTGTSLLPPTSAWSTCALRCKAPKPRSTWSSRVQMQRPWDNAWRLGSTPVLAAGISKFRLEPGAVGD